MTHRFLSVIDIDTSVARKSFFDPAKLSHCPFSWVWLEHSLRLPKGIMDLVVSSGGSGCFYALDAQSASPSNDTNFRFPLFFLFVKGGRGLIFFPHQKRAGIDFRIFYPIRPSIPASFFPVRKSLTGRDSESLMQTAPNCSGRLSTINGRREWKGLVAHDRCRIQSIYSEEVDEWICDERT